MSDETVEHPAEYVADEPVSASQRLRSFEDEAFGADEPVSASQRLRSFEDEAFGADVTRINGQVERGVGSKFAAMTPEQHRVHAALEKLVETEKKLADASAAHATAETAHEAAETAHAAAAEAVDEGKDAYAK